MIDALSVVSRIRGKHGLDEHARVGVVASFNHKANLDVGADHNDLIVIATTDDIDLDDEVVVPTGADNGYITQNAKVFADHRYEIDNVVGSIRSWSAYPDRKNQRGWMARVRLGTTEAAETVKRIVKDHGHIGASIGFEALDVGPPNDGEKAVYTRNGKAPSSVVRKFRLLELSLTALPCNVSCQTMGIAMGDGKAERVAQMVKSGRISRKGAAMLGVHVDQPRRVVVYLGGA